MKFRKKPVVIEAVQWTGENATEVLSFGNSGPAPLWGADFQIHGLQKKVELLTPESVMTAVVGDWLVRGVAGEFYPCKPDIFAATYEPAESEGGAPREEP